MLAKMGATALTLLLMLAAPAAAQERPEGAPSASIAIQQLHLAFIGSAALGGGTLTYKGRSYPISVSGLGIGGIGASRLTASGPVYGLRRRDDLAGVYTQVRSGWALGAQGQGTLWLSNDKGVTMKLNTRRSGLQLTLGADGVIIGFK
jgi:hypothetical protein